MEASEQTSWRFNGSSKSGKRRMTSRLSLSARIWICRLSFLLAAFSSVFGGLVLVAAVGLVLGGPEQAWETILNRRRVAPSTWQVLVLPVGIGATLLCLVRLGLWVVRKTGFLTEKELGEALRTKVR